VAFADLAVALGTAIIRADSAIASVDANPIMVGTVGSGATIVDAVVVTAEPA
jgi:hypothetical protein